MVMTRSLRHAFLAFVLLQAGRVEAASHYVRSSAAGSSTGEDWTNACTDFTGACAVGSLVRGDTYYVATGVYAGGRTFTVPAVGAAAIVIQGATAADHGTSTGWQASFGVDVSQAHFGNGLVFNSSYWVFDGAVGSGATAMAYGFTLDKPSCANNYTAIDIGATVNITITNVTIAHVAFLACSQDIGKQAIYQYTQTNSWNSSSVSHCLFDGWDNAVTFEGQGVTNTDHTFEYNYLQHASSSSAHHGEQIDVDGQSVTNLTVRYNIFADCLGTACVAANNSPILGGAFYGNIVGNANTGNGIFGTGSPTYMKNVVVYNNTFHNSQTQWWFSACSDSTSVACTNATGNIAMNNLIWQMPGSYGGGVGTIDYNAYFQTTDQLKPEAHGQVSSATPFLNPLKGDFHLLAPTNNGLALPAPYDRDMFGAVRGADGVWDRGAIEFLSTAELAAPTNARIVR